MQLQLRPKEVQIKPTAKFKVQPFRRHINLFTLANIQSFYLWSQPSPCASFFLNKVGVLSVGLKKTTIMLSLYNSKLKRVKYKVQEMQSDWNTYAIL